MLLPWTEIELLQLLLTEGIETFVLSIAIDQKRLWQTKVARIVYVKKKTYVI